MLLQLWLRDGSNNWKSSTGAFHLKSQGLASQYQQLHASQAHKRLHDFDEHLNDITKCAVLTTLAVVIDCNFAMSNIRCKCAH